MNKPTHVIVHCSDSTWGSASSLRSWHKARGWNDIGYNFVVCNSHVEPDKTFIFMDGSIEKGRDTDEEGAHCIGYNDRSIGVCLVGAKDFTTKQLDSLKILLLEICRLYKIPAENVLGHGETESGKAEGKTCPNFDVGAFRTYLKGRI